MSCGASRRGSIARAALVLLLSLAAAGAPASAAPLDPRHIKSATLGNGLVLVVYERPGCGIASVEVVVRAGSADEPDELAGIAHLLEHVCWVSGGGSDPRLRIENRGGTTNAGTLRDYTRFYASVPAADFPTALGALADMVLRPSFDPRVIARERRAIAEEVAARRDRARVRLSDLAFQELFGDTCTYARPIEGSAETLAAIQPHQLAAFHQSWYAPNNMAVVVAGEVPFASALAEVERAFGGLSPQALPPRRRGEAPRPAPGKELILPAPGSQAWVMAAFVGPAADERNEVAATDVLSVLLNYGALGRLSRELVETKKLASGAGLDFLTQRERALFGLWAMCDPDKVPAVKQEIRAQLRRLAEEPVTPAELARAKRLVYAGYCFANETPADCASTLAFYEAVDSYRSAIQYPGRLGSVTPQDIARVAGWYAGDPVWVVLMPRRNSR